MWSQGLKVPRRSQEMPKGPKPSSEILIGPKRSQETPRGHACSQATAIPACHRTFLCFRHGGLFRLFENSDVPALHSPLQGYTQCHRRSPNVAVKCHSRMELRPPTARKSHPNFFAHCKRSTKMKKYKKTIIPNVQNTIRTQVTPMVLNYGKLSKNDIF